MQTSVDQLKRQQIIMKVLGFYNDHINGVWGPTSIAAKKKFEQSPKFSPGVPNNGLPFREGVRYPAGIMLRKDGLLWHPAIDDELKGAEKEVSSIPEAPTVPRQEVQITEHTPTATTTQGVKTELSAPVDPALAKPNANQTKS